MAFPTIPTVAAGRVLTTNQTDSSGTRTFPSLSSLTKNSGDLLIAIIVAYQTSTGTDAAFSSWGGGFTEFHDSATGTTLAIGAAYKWSTGSETGTFTVTQAATITGDASLILLSIPGAHASTPPEAGSRASGTSAAADPASFNPGGWDAEDTLWISVVGSGMTSGTGSWTATGTTAPSNYTDRVDTNASDTSTIGDVEAAVAFRQLNAASEDVGTAGVDTSNARNGAIVIAVRPAVVIVSGVADLAGTGALTATATVVRHATADVAGTGAFAASATISNPAVQGIADLVGTGTFASESSVTVHPTADLAGTGDLGAVGSVTRHAAADLAGTGSFDAAAAVTRHAAADIVAAGVLAAEGRTVVHGTSDLAGTGTFVADATVVGNSVFAEADLAGTATFEAAATITTPPVQGVADLAGVGTFEAAGRVVVYGSADLNGTGVWAASVDEPAPLGPDWPAHSGSQWETRLSDEWDSDDAGAWQLSSSTVWS